MLERICSAEPRISAEYLLRGEGEPLRDKRQATDLTTVEQLREFKEEMVQALEKRTAELKAENQQLKAKVAAFEARFAKIEARLEESGDEAKVTATK